jgi:hypothetical protein
VIGEGDVQRLVARERRRGKVRGRSELGIDEAILAASDEEEEDGQERERPEEGLGGPRMHHEPHIIARPGSENRIRMR